MRNIIWLEDFSTDQHPGGAQLTNKIIMDHGRNVGYFIDEYNLQDFKSGSFNIKDLLKEDSLFILNNIVHLYKHFPKEMVKILNTKNYVRYEHDYLWDHNIMPRYMMKKVYENAKFKIFLSPLHQNTHKIKGMNIENSIIIPSPIDTKTFYNKKFSREKKSYIYIGGVSKHKGSENIFKFARENKDIKVDIYGWVDHKELLDDLPENVFIFDKVDYSKVPDLLNEYEYAIHLPNWNEPFGRFCAEAYLCGCKILTNNRNGFYSFGWTKYDTVKDNLENAPRNFWMNINSIIGKIYKN